MIASLVLLSIAARSIPIGTAYAVWVGIGASGAALVGIGAHFFLGLIVIAVAGLEATAAE